MYLVERFFSFQSSKHFLKKDLTKLKWFKGFLKIFKSMDYSGKNEETFPFVRTL